MWISLGILAVSSIIAVINVLKKPKNSSRWLNILLVLLILGALGLQTTDLLRREKEKAVSTYAGVLQGSRTTLLSTNQAIYPKLKLGNSETYITWQGPNMEPFS